MNRYRINPEKGMEIGFYTVGDHVENPYTGQKISTDIIQSTTVSQVTASFFD